MTCRTIATVLMQTRLARSAVPLVACLGVASGAVAATPVLNGRYSGSTSEHTSVGFRIVAGPTVKSFKTTLHFDFEKTGCAQGGGPLLGVDVAKIRISPSGRFSTRTTLTFQSLHHPGRVSGRIAGSTVRGAVAELTSGRALPCWTETFTARRR